MRKYVGILCFGMAALLFACKSKNDPAKPSENSKDREVLLKNYAEEIVIPSYALFKTHFDSMFQASQNFTANPDSAKLLAFRNAWANAYIEWQKVEMFDFGPAETHTLRNFFNIYPASVAGITANILDPTANLEVPAAYPQQGFPALDYLLNGVGNNDSEILAYYLASGDGSKRLAYLQRLSDRMNTLLTTVIAEWNGTFKDNFISKTGLDLSSSTSLMVNGIVLHYERFIRAGKFGIPSGAMVNGVVSPEKVEGYYKKDISLMLAKTAHKSYVDFFNGKSVLNGTEGSSLKTYLNSLNARDGLSGNLLTDILNAQFDTCRTKMELLQPNLAQEVVSNNEAVKNVYNEMQKTTRMLKVDMTSAMSITITYTDNDGD